MVSLYGLLIASALAEPIQAVATIPGNAAVARPCTPDPRDACWEDAARLERFAAESGELIAPALRDVRLARSGGDLLLRVGTLEPGEVLEVLLDADAEGDLREADWFEVGEGLAVLPAGLASGQIRYMRLHLRSEPGGGAAPSTRSWSASGPGRLSIPWPLLAADPLPASPAPTDLIDPDAEEAPPFEIEFAYGTLSVWADGASDLVMEAEREQVPSNSRGVPDPWSVEGADYLLAPLLSRSGWYTLTGLWRGEDGVLQDLQRVRLYVEADGPRAAAGMGIHPAPARLQERLNEAPFTLYPGARICLGDPRFQAAGELASAELERLVGVSAPVSACTPAPSDIWLGAPSGMGLSPRMIAAGPEAFSLRVSGDGAWVGAEGPAGAVWGALALVDALAWGDGESPAFDAMDTPALDLRVLYHRIDARHPQPFDVDRYLTFLERVVARGRYNALVLNLRGAYRWSSHPELAAGGALNEAQVRRILDRARALGMEVIPAIDVPGHADWILRAHPELQEDRNTKLVCTRHPDLKPLLGELMDEMLALFDQPDWVHIGHDEAFWRSESSFGDERCPRCGASPRWELFAEHLGWWSDELEARGVRPMVWADMLVRGWNGGAEGTYRALDVLEPRQRARLMAVSWSWVGDPIDALGEKGVEIVRGHTGYLDWRRAGLVGELDAISGEAMVLTFPAPWTAFGWATGPRPLHYHWASVLLAGATAWQPLLSDTPIGTSLSAMSELPAYAPGFRFLGGQTSPLTLDGPRPGETVPCAVLPRSAEVRGLTYRFSQPAAASVGAPVEMPVGRAIRGLSILQATSISRDEGRKLYAELLQAGTRDGAPVAELQIRYSDGEVVSRPLYYGLDTYRPDGGGRGALMWGAAGRLALASPEAAAFDAEARDRSWFRLDWENPRPDVPVEAARLVTSREGAAVVVLAGVVVER